MRTTVTIDEDVAESLRGFAHRHGLSFKKALNELLRRGLRAQVESRPRERFQVEPHRGGFRPGIDPARLNQLLDELETNDFRREAARTAALALEYQAEVHSNDADFSRFPGLRWRNPLA